MDTIPLWCIIFINCITLLSSVWILIYLYRNRSKKKFFHIYIWNSFIDRTVLRYCLEPFEQTQGNCNSSSSTLLYKAGVPLSRIKDLRKRISGLVWGFGDIKPWTVEEQSKAVQRQREFDQLRNEMMNTIILNKY